MNDYVIVHGSSEALPSEAVVNGATAPDHSVQLVPFITGAEVVTPEDGAHWHDFPYQPTEPRGYYHVFTLVVQDGQRIITHADRHVRIV